MSQTDELKRRVLIFVGGTLAGKGQPVIDWPSLSLLFAGFLRSLYV
jgi:hypothetical protein